MIDRSLLLTRPEKAARRFVAELDQRCLVSVDICYSPVLDIVPTRSPIDLTGYHSVIFTSGNAVALVPEVTGMNAFCVGPGTAEQASSRGWNVSYTAQDADDLVKAMMRFRPDGPILHIAGAHRRGEVAERLRDTGLTVDVVTVYDQQPLQLNAQAKAMLDGERPVILPLFSPRSAEQFLSQAERLANVHVIAISDAVARLIIGKPVSAVETAPLPNGTAMRQMVEMVLRRDSLA
ncbi:Uroporphyrinogen-III synthase [Sulfitobacter noctilucicola]|uniref:Uroporphyrinogen-III synthase n=1 Tax=Sulfitobacter noctilucicola TaxID=1342301 RepID=A0A7W6M5S4_9RHOB|nr:uroporphyrinogen-III synthase [Sulfitobacter noctilucicola]KIN62861.1 Uroporphyrinogen-III synthase [Sulfitobacter noctilucicola]MBB4172608.1 uroporphyrinogen-III synthase [Sulfitobacter noctilucicola]